MSGIGLQQNIFFYGVVEDRNDPEQLGRVRVRVLGVHSDNSADVPTSALPWAPVVLPSTSAGTSGIGVTPLGLVEGSWVLVFFADGMFYQNPVVLGTTVGINPTQKEVNTPSTKEHSESTNTVGKPQDVKYLGVISEKYEVGTRGPGYVSSGSGDLGGRSYGSYQLSSATGTLRKYLGQSAFKSAFAGMEPNSTEFISTWKRLGMEQKEAFKQDQHSFIEKTHFVPCVSKLAFLDINQRSDAVSEMVFSYSVQYGAAGGASKIKRALNGKNVSDLSDADIIELCYNDRRDNVATDFKSSPTLHAGLKTRFANEKKDILALCGQKPTTGLKKADPLPKDSYGAPVESAATITQTPTYQRKVGNATFVDPSGKYPKAGYLGKVDTNRLARNTDINRTIQKIKRLSAVSANGFVEKHTYGAKYPYNKVNESESGHVIEQDDTPGSERVHIYHRAGSFIEFHPDGTIVKKSVSDDQEVVISNKSVYVFGNSNVFVEGNVKIQTLGNIDMEAEGNISIRAQGNMNIEAGGQTNISSVGNVEITSDATIKEFATDILHNRGTKSANVEVDVGAKFELQRILADEELPPKTDDWGNESAGQEQTFATKKELDELVGFETSSGPATTEAKTMEVEKAATTAPEVSSVDATETFKPSFRLSKNFILGDLTTGTAAFKYALKAQCGLSEKDIVKNMMFLSEGILEPIVEHFGRNAFIITNSFRHFKQGKSQHYFGQAVDIQFPGNADRIPHIAQEIKLLLPDWDQLIVEYHANNPVIHISFKPTGNRKAVFSTYSTNFAGLRPFGIYDKNQQMIYPA